MPPRGEEGARHGPPGEEGARGRERGTMRLFLAVFPPPEAQAAVVLACAPLRAAGGGVSWVRAENLHYTLRFMGELGADGARRAGEAASEAASDHAPFEAALGDFGAFPDARRARVLWVGLAAGDAPLRALAASLKAALARRGFGRADRPFAPHLTVGRVRAGADWSAELATARVPGATFTVDRLLLVRSTLSPRGSTYETVSEARLGG